ncbi:MAG: hypothetical protein CVU65_10190 [Deltaproteobacteria bacterium HGW-Deltaproteobacteria-22]|jgi:hypothetical protein|nr:MAG: hypothetical protein CVU65_10190 [Deltaproteobacteria bacterium HGW-Deltaproteobacteria-22]
MKDNPRILGPFLLLTLTAGLALLATACGKSGDADSSVKITRVKEGPGPTGDTPLITRAEREQIIAALQGRWLVPGRVTDDPSKPSPMGLNTVWEITGDKLVTWDGEKEQPGRFEIVAPCLARLFKTKPGGNESFSYDTIHIDGGTFFHSENLAVRRGDAVIGCLSHGDVFLVRNGACLKWDSPKAAAGDGEKADCKVEGETLVISGETSWTLPIVAPAAKLPKANSAKKIASREEALNK